LLTAEITVHINSVQPKCAAMLRIVTQTTPFSNILHNPPEFRNTARIPAIFVLFVQLAPDSRHIAGIDPNCQE